MRSKTKNIPTNKKQYIEIKTSTLTSKIFCYDFRQAQDNNAQSLDSPPIDFR